MEEKAFILVIVADLAIMPLEVRMRPNRLTAILCSATIACTGLTGCATTESLGYAHPPTATEAEGPATVAMVRVTDDRGESDPTWFGAIRGGFGNPLKVLHAPVPVQQVVATAFTDALKARGLVAATGSGGVDIVINIRDFDANQIVRREANVDQLVRVVERGSDKTVFQDEVKKTIVRGNVITLDAGV